MIVLSLVKVKRYYTAYITFIEIKYQLAIFFMKVYLKMYVKVQKNPLFEVNPKSWTTTKEVHLYYEIYI